MCTCCSFFNHETHSLNYSFQWFYGIVSNSPYNNTWIDEGFTDFETHLYFIDRKGQSEETVYGFALTRIKQDEQHKMLKPAHLPISEYKTGGFSSANYKVPTVKLWEISGHDAKKALSFLKTYIRTYAYQEVDAHEWFRFV